MSWIAPTKVAAKQTGAKKAIEMLNDKITYTGILSGAINANAGEKDESK